MSSVLSTCQMQVKFMIFFPFLERENFSQKKEQR